MLLEQGRNPVRGARSQQYPFGKEWGVSLVQLQREGTHGAGVDAGTAVDATVRVGQHHGILNLEDTLRTSIDTGSTGYTGIGVNGNSHVVLLRRLDNKASRIEASLRSSVVCHYTSQSRRKRRLRYNIKEQAAIHRRAAPTPWAPAEHSQEYAADTYGTSIRNVSRRVMDFAKVSHWEV